MHVRGRQPNRGLQGILAHVQREGPGEDRGSFDRTGPRARSLFLSLTRAMLLPLTWVPVSCTGPETCI